MEQQAAARNTTLRQQSPQNLNFISWSSIHSQIQHRKFRTKIKKLLLTRELDPDYEAVMSLFFKLIWELS